MEKTVKRDLVIGVLVTIAYAIAGTMFGESVSNVMSYVLIMTLFGLSFNLQFGYAGMTSLGQCTLVRAVMCWLPFARKPT